MISTWKIVCALLCLGLLTPALSSSAAATLEIDVDPATPTTWSEVLVGAWKDFPDTGYELVSFSGSRLGFNISLDIVVRDLHEPGMEFAQVITPLGGTENFGLLPAGDYSVSAAMGMIPVGGFYPMPIDSDQDSFTVVPEPSMLSVLGVGAFGVLLRPSFRRSR